MTNISSSRRYAQAIISLADENGDLDSWKQDLEVLRQLWENLTVRAYLEDVRVSSQKRLERARATLGTRLSPLALNFVLVLLDRGRSTLIPYIVRQFEDTLRERDSKAIVQVVSALPLTGQQREELQAKLADQTGKTVALEESIDPEILGGLILRVDDQLLDLSTAGKLRRLREKVVGRAV